MGKKETKKFKEIIKNAIKTIEKESGLDIDWIEVVKQDRIVGFGKRESNIDVKPHFKG